MRHQPNARLLTTLCQQRRLWHPAYHVRGNAHTNTLEGFYSIFKRGMKDVYRRCGEKHLHRYLAESDFRYNNRGALGVEDRERATNALRGIVAGDCGGGLWARN